MNTKFYSRNRREVPTAKRKRRYSKWGVRSLNIHHREPLSLGGKDEPGNRIRVPRGKHRAWHTLFDNFPPRQVFNEFEHFYYIFGPGRLEVESYGLPSWKWNRRRPKAKLERAWRCLFRNKSLDQILKDINNIWIDPRYEIRTRVVEDLPELYIICKRR